MGPNGLVRAFNHIFDFFCKEFLRNYVYGNETQ